MVIIYHFMAFLVLNLPRRFILFLVQGVTRIYYWTTPAARHRVQANLKTVLGNNGTNSKKIERLTKEVYLNFGRYLYEFFFIPKVDKTFLERHLEIKGVEHLDSAFKKGKGVISLTGHIGNWELGGIFTALLGYPISAIALSHKSTALNRFFLRRRQMKGIKVIPLGAQTKKIISSLKRNELVALLGDRPFGPPYVKLTFFGQPALLPAGPAQIAVKLGTPIVPGFLIRQGEKYLLSFYPVLEYNRSLEPQQAVEDLAQQTIPYLEKYIRKYPSQWLVFDYVWKKELP